jgi:hypothetical protein
MEAKQDMNPPRKTNNGRPMQLEFYPGAWVSILERAKKYFHVWLVTNHAWPERDIHLADAETCLTAAIEEYSRGGQRIDEGVSQ